MICGGKMPVPLLDLALILCESILCIMLYVGCGMHIEQALAGVPVSERCACPRQGCEVQTKPAPAPAATNTSASNSGSA